MRKELKFISLMQDIVFKTLWQSDDQLIKDYFRNLILYIVDIDISNYSFKMNEIPIDRVNDISSRVDILLESPDKQTKINIELNPINLKITNNKNNSYLYKIAGGMYKRNVINKYEGKIRVIQINFNGFYYRGNMKCPMSRYKLRDTKLNDTIEDIEIINIFLPAFKKLCYTNDNDIYKDFAMFATRSYKEMASYAKDNRKRVRVMEKIKEIALDDELPTYDYNLYLEGVKEELARNIEKRVLRKTRRQGLKDGRQAGIKEGRQAGIKEERNNIINKLLSSGMTKEELSKRLSMPIL